MNLPDVAGFDSHRDIASSADEALAVRVAEARLTRAKRGLLALCTATILLGLSACGGGGSDTASGTVASLGSSAASANAQALSAGHGDGATTADAGDTTTWTTIASENQSFTVSGTQTVRYGNNGVWIAMSVTDSGQCSNAAFGNDPLFGVAKICQVASTPAWTTIAEEDQPFTVSGTQTVRYGANGSFITKQVSGDAVCSNSFFGSDPLFGVKKSCQVDSTSAAPVTWTRIAGENENFTLGGTQMVRYGANGTYIIQSVTGSGVCSNDYFGSDPLYGVVKQCEVASTGSATPPVATAGVCTAPADPANTSGAVATVGNGTPASCTEAALRAAVGQYAVVKFNCGAAPAVIPISATIVVPVSRDTVIDGENKITLDGGGAARIFSATQNNYRTNAYGLTLQHLVLRNGKAPGGTYTPPNPGNPACSYGYGLTGSGAAIYVQDAKLHVFDVDFQNNAAATPGPDVGGGAIYALGSTDVLISGSRFTANSGSNSGAVGMLNSDLHVYNSVFSGNSANGIGQNYQSPEVASCPGIGQSGQGGSGGLAGALGIDGGDDRDLVICGSTFIGNHANELAGAIGRTPDQSPQRTTIDRSLFRNNTARQGGALFIINSAPLEIFASTFDSNSATLFGAAQLQNSTLNIVNSTFTGNLATAGVGGTLALFGNASSSVIQNVTFVDNQAQGGGGYFSAAIFGDSGFPIFNTVFSNNTTGDANTPMQCTFNAASGANDVQWPRNRVVGGAPDTLCVFDIAFVDPLLAGVADNGGPTPTRAPASNSPLRGAGRNCPATDQRGNPRNPGACTIGAVE